MQFQRSREWTLRGTITEMKNRVLHSIVRKEEHLFVASFLEIELASQGKTKKEAVANLKEALSLYLEEEDLDKLHLPSIEEVDMQTIPLT